MTRTPTQPRENSPFTPGQPAPPEVFSGRQREVERLRRSLLQTASGKPQAMFIGGARGLGKSSLARFCRFISEQDNPVLPNDVKLLAAYNTCGRCRTVLDVCKLVVQNTAGEITEESRLKQAQSLLARYIKQVSIPFPGFKVNVDLKDNRADLEDLHRNFPRVLGDLWRVVGDRKQGMLLILDDVNGLAGDPEFAAFIKSTWEDLVAAQVPVCLLLVGLEERLAQLIEAHESVGRIFDRIVLEPMPLEDVKDFFRRAYGSVELEVEDPAVDLLARLSGGYPVMMHELGDATYWVNEDGTISIHDAIPGLLEAAERVGEKYFSPQVYEAVQSDAYRRILFDTVADPLMPGVIRRKGLIEDLPDQDARNVDNFLRRMVELGVMRRTEPGCYEYAYPMFPVYLQLEKRKEEQAG